MQTFDNVEATTQRLVGVQDVVSLGRDLETGAKPRWATSQMLTDTAKEGAGTVDKGADEENAGSSRFPAYKIAAQSEAEVHEAEESAAAFAIQSETAVEEFKATAAEKAEKASHVSDGEKQTKAAAAAAIAALPTAEMNWAPRKPPQ